MSIRRGLLATLLVLAACDKAEPMATADQRAVGTPVEAVAEETPAADEATDAPAVPNERMVIRKAHLLLRADSPDAVAATAAQLAEQAGGFVANSDTQGVGETIHRVDASLRVPAERFESVMRQLRDQGELLQETMSGEDVTAAHADLDARLRSQRTLEERLLTILGSVQTVEDALSVETQLVAVRTEIERLEARMRTMEDQVAMATISLAVEAPHRASALPAETVSSRLGRAVDDAGELFVGALAGLIRVVGALLPLGLVFGPLGWAGHRAWRRRRRQQALVAAAGAGPTMTAGQR